MTTLDQTDTTFPPAFLFPNLNSPSCKVLCSNINLQVLQESGCMVWDLRSWQDREVTLPMWKRQPRDECVGDYGFDVLTLDPSGTQLLVHAIDFGYYDEGSVKRCMRDPVKS